MNTEETDKAIARIRKLMEHARCGGATEAEMETYLNKARQMMEQFNIDEQAVLLSGEDAAKKNFYESIVNESGYSRAGGIDAFDRRMAMVACNVCDTKCYNSMENGRMHMYFYGLPRDVAITKALYIELLASMRAMCKVSLGPSWGKGYNSYCQGFVVNLYERSKAQKESSVATSGTTAIVLAKDGILKSWSTANLSLTSDKSKSRGPSNMDAFFRGYQDGSAVDLGTRGIPNQRGATAKQISSS